MKKKYKTCSEHPEKKASIECAECGKRLQKLNAVMTGALLK